jgi:predicted Zn-dependent protease
MSLAILILIGLLSPLGCGGGTPSAGQMEDDEQRLWKQVLDEQRRLDRSGHLYEDPDLKAYVNHVAQRVGGERYGAQGLTLEVKIIKNPLLNAFTYPNGVIYVHTGIVAKMENEAQLATLLGHEMTHAINRHAIDNRRTIKKASATITTFQILTLPFGLFGSLANLIGTTGGVAAISGYSQDLEREADNEGLALVVKAGYDPSESTKLFEHLKKDVEENNIKEPFFFGTHPRLIERIDNYQALLETKYQGVQGEIGDERFAQNVKRVRLDNALLDLSAGRFVTAEKGLKRALEQDSSSATLHAALGEVYRQRSEATDSEKAEAEFLVAIHHDPNYAPSYKGLGLVYYRGGQREKARKQFSQFLQVSKDSSEKRYVEQYLMELKLE